MAQFNSNSEIWNQIFQEDLSLQETGKEGEVRD